MPPLKSMRTMPSQPGTFPLNKVTFSQPFPILRALNGAELQPSQRSGITTGLRLELPKNCFGKLELHRKLSEQGVILLDHFLKPNNTETVTPFVMNPTNQVVNVYEGQKLVWVLISAYTVPSEIEVRGE